MTPNLNMGQIAAEVWEWMIRVTPDPYMDSYLYYALTGEPRPSYRALLDKQPRNYYGELIPRIDTVRLNLLRLRNTRLNPMRIP